jgi:hypothetical protein
MTQTPYAGENVSNLSAQETRDEYAAVREEISRLDTRRKKLAEQLREQIAEGNAAEGVTLKARAELVIQDAGAFLEWATDTLGDREDFDTAVRDPLIACLSINAKAASAILEDADLTEEQKAQAAEHFSFKRSTSIDVK